MGLLEGKVALVTGAGRGIGRAVALAFAREGASLVVNDLGCERDGSGRDPSVARAVADEIAALGGRAVPSAHSVAERSEVEELFALIGSEFGRLDVLVNNAGIIADKSVLDLSDDNWRSVLETHLTGTFFCTR
ncbi:MAG TPA: SDR family NAD(P)-dependent oxidoreductase, partial [Polyangiaceae bacterium]|nr:SDR family NAD(P)-dependent oxidoreductase [Polyangiaceae bacterium]